MTDAIFTADAPLYWIAHGAEAVHFGALEAKVQLSTGQPHLETFVAEGRDAWAERLAELGMTAPDPWPDPPETETGPPVLPQP